MDIARVFPRKTKATPTDELAFVGAPPKELPNIDAVHVSVTFTWDLPEAERLAKAWGKIAPVEIGGPATMERGGAFTPGQYLREGYVITSRGCPNRCWFCSVWRREGQEVRELPIANGSNVLDDNLLACSDAHVRAVFAMLKRQHERIQFTGGLEAARLKRWHSEELRKLHPKQLFFAYDTPDDLEPLQDAGKMLLDVGFTTASHSLRCYVLCGYPKDTFAEADQRMNEAVNAGFFPMAMLWKDNNGNKDPEWAQFQRTWARPAIIASKLSANRRRE